MIHFVRGTLAIEWSAGTLKISVTPGAGFITPEKEATHVIAFPFRFPAQGFSGDATLIPLTEKKFECDATALAGDLAGLIAIAAQQKLIEIRMKQKSSGAWKLVGFAFPVS